MTMMITASEDVAGVVPTKAILSSTDQSLGTSLKMAKDEPKSRLRTPKAGAAADARSVQEPKENNSEVAACINYTLPPARVLATDGEPPSN